MAPVSSLTYRLCHLGGRFTFLCTMNLRLLRAPPPIDGPYVLAVTHLSHVEPFLVSTVHRRPIDWVARSEFYAHRPLAFMLRKLNAIKVNRRGVPVRMVRTAMDRLAAGRVVGIFPEGGVSRGDASVCVGGPIKYGGCLIACRANVPIVPCVVVGSHELNRVGPWLPFTRAHVWMAFGDPIVPPADAGPTVVARRATYRALGDRLKSAFVDLYSEVCRTYGLTGRAGETFAEAGTASAGYADDPARRPTVPAAAARTS